MQPVDEDELQPFSDYFGGWLVKLPGHMNDVDKGTSIARTIGRTVFSITPAALRPFSYRKRYFVLDGNELRYYRDDTCRYHVGTVDLGTVLDVQWATRDHLHPHSFDLITDARTFTLAPLDASHAVAREWFDRIVYKIETSRKRGMLARSLRSSAIKRMSSVASRSSSQLQLLAETASASWLVGGVTALVPPLYLSHEACRVFPDAIAAGTLAAFLPAAGAGGVSSSGLPVLLAHESPSASALVLASRSPHLPRPNLTPASAAAAVAAALALSPRGLQALLMTAMVAGGGAGGGAASAAALGMGAAGVLPPVSSTASIGPGGGQGEPSGGTGGGGGGAGDGDRRTVAAVVATEAKQRRGSTIFAGYDVVRLAHPTSVAAIAGASISAASDRKSDAASAWGPLFAAPQRSSAKPCVAAAAPRLANAPPPLRRNRRVAREVTRWEEITGNMPRWSLSIVNEHRLKHVAAFAPLLGLGPGQTGWREGTNGRPGLAPGLAAIAALTGGTADASSKKKKKKKAKGAKAKQKRRGRGDGDDDDDDDEDEDDDEAARMAEEEGALGTGLARGAGTTAAAVATVAAALRDDSDGASAVIPSAASGVAAPAASPTRAGTGREVASTADTRMKASVLLIKQRVQLLLAGDVSSVAAKAGNAGADATAAAAALPGSRGPEASLLLALSSTERRHVAAMLEQLAEQRGLGWDVSMGGVEAADARARPRPASLLDGSTEATLAGRLRHGPALLRGDSSASHQSVARSLLARVASLAPLVRDVSHPPPPGPSQASRSSHEGQPGALVALAACNRVSRQSSRVLRRERASRVLFSAALWPIQELGPRRRGAAGSSPARTARARSRSGTAGSSPSLQRSLRSGSGAASEAAAPAVTDRGGAGAGSTGSDPGSATSSAGKDDGTLDFDLATADPASAPHHTTGDEQPPASGGPTPAAPAASSVRPAQPLTPHQRQRALAFIERVSRRTSRWTGARPAGAGGAEENPDGPPPGDSTQQQPPAAAAAAAVTPRRKSAVAARASLAMGSYSLGPVGLAPAAATASVSQWPSVGRNLLCSNWADIAVGRRSRDAPLLATESSRVGSLDMLNGTDSAFTLPPGHPALDVAGFACGACWLPTSDSDAGGAADAAEAVFSGQQHQTAAAVLRTFARIRQHAAKLGGPAMPAAAQRFLDASASETHAAAAVGRRTQAAVALCKVLPALLHAPLEVSACVLVPRWFRPEVRLSAAALAAAARSEQAKSFFSGPSALRSLWSGAAAPPSQQQLPRLAHELALGVEMEVPLLCSGSRYGLPSESLLNGFEEPRSNFGVPAEVALPPAARSAYRGRALPGAVAAGHPWVSNLPQHGICEEGGAPAESGVLSLDPWGDPDADAGDPIEAALGFFKLHCVPAGTVLFRAEPPFVEAEDHSAGGGGAPSLPTPRQTSGSSGGSGEQAPLLGLRSSLYVLLHGRVRLTFPLLPKVVSGDRKAWRALKRAVSAVSIFRRLGLPTTPFMLQQEASGAAGKTSSAGPHLRTTSSTGSFDVGSPQSPGDRRVRGAEPTAGSGDGGGATSFRERRTTAAQAQAAAPSPSTPSAPLNPSAASVAAASGAGAGGGGQAPPPQQQQLWSCVGMTVGATCGVDRAGCVWVEASALAAPVLLGLPAMRGRAPHWATVTVAEGSFLLELRPDAHARLCRTLPASGAALEVIASFWQPNRVVAAVPALVAAFADTAPAPGWTASDRAGSMAALAALARPVVLSPGEALFNEGDPADAAYIVVAGRIAVSAFASSAGVHALLAVCGRGACVGESGLVAAGTLRTTRAVALTSTVVLRLSHDSLSAVLARRPRVWRAVRNAIVWRGASQLVRLPLLSYLVGGESESGRLAPLADLFGAVVLAEDGARDVVMAPPVFDMLAADAADAPPDELPQTVPWLCSETAVPIGCASSSSSSSSDSPSLAGSVLLVAHGIVASVLVPPLADTAAADATSAAASGALPEDLAPALACTALSPGEWLDASCSPLALGGPLAADAGEPLWGDAAGGTVVGVALPQLLSECCAGPLAAAGRRAPSPDSLPPLSAGVSPTAVLLRLSPSHLAAFVATLPAGPKRLQQWHSSKGAVGASVSAGVGGSLGGRLLTPRSSVAGGGGGGPAAAAPPLVLASP